MHVRLRTNCRTGPRLSGQLQHALGIDLKLTGHRISTSVPSDLEVVRTVPGGETAALAAALRALLAGESVTVSGEFITLDDVKLTWPPHGDLPLMVGGTGPRTLDFAGSLPHGSLLGNAYSDADLVAACERIHAAHAASPHASSPHAIVYPLLVATGENAEGRLRAEAPLWGKTADDQIGVAGDAATIADYLRRLGAMGVTSVAFETTQDVTDQVGFIRFIGEEVRPLLQN